MRCQVFGHPELADVALLGTGLSSRQEILVRAVFVRVFPKDVVSLMAVAAASGVVAKGSALGMA